MANTTNRTTRIKHVYGNVLKLAIPLTLRVVTLDDGDVVTTDYNYTPSSHYKVVVQFVNGPLKYELDATIRDSYIAVVEDKGTIPVGTYAIVVLCRDDNGDPRRFKQRCVLDVVDVTADAGIEVGIEFEAQEWLLEGAIFLAVKGEDGLDGVGIESITTDETSVSGEYNQVTFHLTNGSSYTLNVRNGESTEQTLPANVVVDENYVHTDNNYTNTDKQKISNIDKLFGDVVYDRISRRLNFFRYGDQTHTTPLKSIDITDWLRDGRVSSFRIVDGNLTIKLNSDGGNEEFKIPISSIFNPNNYYTKEQVEDRILDSGFMAKEDFIYEGSNNIKYSSAPEIVLSHIEGVSPYEEMNSRLFGTSNGHINGYVGATGSALFDYGLAPEGLVFLDKTSGLLYRWTGSSWQQVGGSSGGGSVEQVQADWNQTTTTAPDYIKNKPTLATVATSGSYNDLQDKPTIPAAYDDTTLSGRVSALENAGFITTETDPTVPSWAKADSKPTYTAQEVGALPASTTIPTKVSDLTNDSGFTSNAGTITGITMNGASKGTSGVVDLGTVITAHQDISGKANASDVYTKTQTDTLLAGKQNTLTFDNAPTAGSNNPVKSGGIKTALDAKADAADVPTKTEMADAIDDALGEAEVTVVPANSVGIITSLGSDSNSDALAASMGKKLKVALLQIYAALGNYAFPDGKPTLDFDDIVLFSVTKTIGTGLSSTGGDTDVEMGDSLEVTIAATDNLYVVDDDNMVVTMGGQPVVGAWNASTMKVTIAAVTGNVVINVPSMTYVQDGLAFMLDCKNGVTLDGNSVPTKWTDLKGGIEFSLTSVTIGSNGALVFSGSPSKGVASGGLNVAWETATVEVVATRESNAVMQRFLSNTVAGGVSFSTSQTSGGKKIASFATNDTNVSTPKNISLEFDALNIAVSATRDKGILNGTTDINYSSSTMDYISGLSNSLAVGYRINPSNNQETFLNGTISIIRVYQKKLSDADRKKNYAIDKKRFNLS